MRKFTGSNIWLLLKQTGNGFIKDKITKLSASLAYYTIFSLGPMLIVIIFCANLLWHEEAVEGRIFHQIKNLVGKDVAFQLQEIIKNAAVKGENVFTAVAGFVTLIIGATTVFSEIQDTINTIWRLKLRDDVGFLKTIQTRLLSFSLVVSLGFLLLVSLVIEGLVEGFMDKLKSFFPDITVVLMYIANVSITLLITSTLFAIIFKVLPDAVIRWRDVAVGAVFTAILFMIARFGITLYIGNADVASTYGTAGSLVVLLLWIYFSSIILYLGAEFTKFYAVLFGSEIKPDKYAIIYQTVQVESLKESVQENEMDVENTEKELQKTKIHLDKKQEIGKK